jgi:flagellar biosynthesis/type III secretory pathway chaperone
MTQLFSLSDLIGATNRLVEVLDREVVLLHEGKPQALATLAPEKARLLQVYEANAAGLRNDPSVLKSANPKEKDEVMTAATKLERAIQNNMRALEVARDVNRRLVDTIVQAVTDEQTRGRGYSQTGTGASSAGPRRGEAVSIAFDQRL